MVMPASVLSRVRGAWDFGVEFLGTEMTWRQTKPPQQTAVITAGFRMPSKDDIEIVNAYGMETKIITTRAADLPSPPVKFDVFEANGERYTVIGAVTVQIAGQVLGYRLFAKGS